MATLFWRDHVGLIPYFDDRATNSKVATVCMNAKITSGAIAQHPAPTPTGISVPSTTRRLIYNRVLDKFEGVTVNGGGAIEPARGTSLLYFNDGYGSLIKDMAGNISQAEVPRPSAQLIISQQDNPNPDTEQRPCAYKTLLKQEAETALPDYYVQPIQDAYGNLPVESQKSAEIVPFNNTLADLANDQTDFCRPIPRSYCHTWIDQYGRQSRPSDPINPPVGIDGFSNLHTVSIPAPPPGVARVRVYRALGNVTQPSPEKNPVAWVSVAEVPIAGTISNLIIPDVDDALGHSLDSTEYMPMPDPCLYLRELESGQLVCVEGNRRVIRFSHRHFWHAWAEHRQVSLPSGTQIQHLEVYGNMVYVWTDNIHYIIQVGKDNGELGIMTTTRPVIEAEYGFSGSETVARIPGGFAFSCPTGLIVWSGTTSAMITEGKIDQANWGLYQAQTAAAYFRGAYYGFREDKCTVIELSDNVFAGKPAQFIYQVAVGAVAANVTEDGKFMLLPPHSSQLYQWDMTVPGDMVAVYEKSITVLPSRTQFNACKVIGEDFDITITIYSDGREVMTRTLTHSNPFRLPRHRKGIEYHWKAVIRKGNLKSVLLASSINELSYI